jgi:signal transduction histidine kinase/ActR/RegA family two-component response regulator
LLGLSESDYLGKSNADMQIVCPNHKKLFSELESEEIEIFKSHKYMRNYEIIQDINNQNLTFDFIKIPMYNHDNQPKGLLVVGREITDILNSLEEKKNIEAKALKAQKLESLGILAGGVAHDFNNLLTVILGYTDLALHMISPGEPVFNNLKEIENSSKRAADLCKQMLAYSGKGKFFVQPVNLNIMLKGLNSLINSTVNKKITLNYQLCKELKLIEADTNQIQQLIMNLLLNANEAIDEIAGKISIETDNILCTKDFLNGFEFTSNLTDKECILFKITDTGSGISQDILDKIFDPFFTTRGTGRGLGLPAVMGIVKSHNGAIKIESDTNKGTTVMILFPAIIEQEKQETEDLITHFHFDKKVLIIDDETSILNMTKELLEHLGFSVIPCENSLKAINIYNQKYQNILFTIIDLSMPELDGLELFLSFKNINPDNKSIITSGYHETKAMDRFKDFDDHFFLQKPFNLYELTVKINEFLKQYDMI